MSDDKTCPVCGETYIKTTFTTEDTLNFKVFIHEKKRCKIQHGNVMTPRFLIKNGVLSNGVDSDIIEGIFSKYCKFVQVEDTKNHDFYFPDAKFAVKRYSVDDFYVGMKSRGREDSEIIEKIKEMKARFERVAVLISGNPSVHASEVLDIVSTDINIKIRQIIGFTASIGVNLDLDACFCIENDAELAYWAIKHAACLAKKIHK